MQHSFDIEIAQKYGVNEAIILNYFLFWLSKNKANKKHGHDGRYWTYNTTAAFAEQLPYLTANQVRRTLEKLRKEGLIMVGNYNVNPYDRTAWYTLTDEGMKLLGVDFHTDGEGNDAKSIRQNTQIHLANLPNGNGKNAKPIPVILPVNITVSNTERESIKQTEEINQVNERPLSNTAVAEMQKQGFESFWEAYPRKVSKPLAEIAWRGVPVNAGIYDRILDAVERYKKTRQWQDESYIPYPATFLQDRRWEDDISAPTKQNTPRGAMSYSEIAREMYGEKTQKTPWNVLKMRKGISARGGH